MKIKKYDDRIQFKVIKEEKEVFEQRVMELYSMDMSDFFRKVMTITIAGKKVI